MNISHTGIKKLYGLSAGRCSICQKDLFENDVHVGEMAHIIAKSLGGPRGNQDCIDDRNVYENLILLCANHHLEVDKKPDKYPVEELHRIKREHEKKVASGFNMPYLRENDLLFLNIFMQNIPFTRLPCFVNHLPHSVHLDISRVLDIFDDFCKGYPHLYPPNDTDLYKYFDAFISSCFDLWYLISGYTVIEGREQQNFSQADEYHYIYMEKKYLTREVIIDLSHELDRLNSNFIKSYKELIVFLRKSYHEVDLNSYIGDNFLC